MPGTTLPPFPNNVPTHPLVVIDLDLLKAGDASEIDRLWEAATSIGFWYVKNHGTDKEADDMFDVGAEFMALPLEEKMKFARSGEGPRWGYKKAGTDAADAAGKKPDSGEFFNISKDDILAFPEVVHSTYPAPTTAAMLTVLRPFIRKSQEVSNTIIRIFNDKLGLPEGMLEKQHVDEEHSLSGTRVIRIPPTPEQAAIAADKENQMLGAHTDFGSLTVLHNRLGGLQVMPPGRTEWSYVKPLPGHAICNIGDALAVYSGGVLRSNLHRVVRAPGDQGNYERYSVVFFSRPGNSRVLRALVEDSALVADAVQKNPDPIFNTGQTASEWFTRRLEYMKVHNRKGPEAWATGRGTEHTPTAA